MDLFMVPSNLLFWLAFCFMCFQPKPPSWRINCRNIQLESCKFNWLEPNISNIFTKKTNKKPGDSPNSPNSTIQLGWPAGFLRCFWHRRSRAAEVNDFLERKGLAKYAEKIVEVTDVARIHWLKPKGGGFWAQILGGVKFSKDWNFDFGIVGYTLVMISNFSTLDSLMLFVNYQWINSRVNTKSWVC